MFVNFDFSVINDLVDDIRKEYQKEYTIRGRHYNLALEVSVYVFPQTWGSTALGYGGLGGSAITTSLTIVLFLPCKNYARVYFGGNRLAYEIKNPNKSFFDDMKNFNLASLRNYKKYLQEP